VRFDDYEADGAPHADGTPSGGQFVSSLGHDTKGGAVAVIEVSGLTKRFGEVVAVERDRARLACYAF